MTDLRSLPDSVLKLYLYAVGGWGVVLAILYMVGLLQWALTLCVPLALYLDGLTVWWWRQSGVRLRAGELEEEELSSGVKSIARILAAVGLLPGIVFLAKDPLLPETWGTFIGIAVLSAVGWLLANYGSRLRANAARLAVLVFCGLVLPLNATGSVSVAFFRGWFDRVVQPLVG